MGELIFEGIMPKYANISGPDYTMMIPQAIDGANQVAFNCHNCLASSGCFARLTCDHGHKLGLGRFGSLLTIEFVEPLGDQLFGMWRCSVRCIQCDTIQHGVHFAEAPSAEPYNRTDLPRTWEAIPDDTSQDEATP